MGEKTSTRTIGFPTPLPPQAQTMRQRLLTWVIPWLALSAALFLAWMNPGILNPTRVAWLLDGNDHGASAIGMAAYLRAPPAWPWLYSNLLMAPEGIPLALTDGN